ncbi:MAG TPA: dTMP kinase [Pirellulales bacterium]|jgi:dTMP kinase|nr:dTMP kinase [Pirellulales bacterium]
MFLSFDGVDGAGKSTQLDLFCAWLGSKGRDVVRCRDPGTTSLGEAIRKLLLDRQSLTIASRAEMLLYMAARAQLVDEIIRPALDAGSAVVSDRYLLANVVYQGHALGLPTETVWEVGRVATSDLRPDLTIVLDLAPEAAAERMKRTLDHMEQRGIAYQAAVRAGFLHEASLNPDEIAIVNAARSVDAVHAEIIAIVERKFSLD